MSDQLETGYAVGLGRWSEGALIYGDRHIWLATESRLTRLLEQGPEVSPTIGVASGGAGVVHVANGTVRYSPYGKEWLDVTPPELREIFADGLGWPMSQLPVEVAVTDTAVLIRLALQGSPREYESAWFLGTPTTG